MNGEGAGGRAGRARERRTWRIKFNGRVIYGLGGHIILFADNLPGARGTVRGGAGGDIESHFVPSSVTFCPPAPAPAAPHATIPATVVFRSDVAAAAVRSQKGPGQIRR